MTAALSASVTAPALAVAVPAPLVVAPPVLDGRDLDVEASGVRLRVTHWTGPGVPVLLLHGLASSRRFWDLVVPGLSDHEIVALDQRGHGDSERPAGPYDGTAVVADTIAVLDALGLGSVVVVGHSWGATTALRLAARHGDRVSAVVAIDGGFGSARSTGSDRAAARARLTPPRTALPPDRMRALLSHGPLAPWWDERLAAALLPLFGIGDDGLARARLPYEAHMQILDDLLDAGPPPLEQIACPTWLVACDSGADDDWSRAKLAALDRAQALLAQPRLQRWTGALHDVPLQWPALVSGLILAAVDEATHCGGAPGPGRAGAGS